MIKGPKDILILLLGLFALGTVLIFLPWSELNFTGNFPDWLSAVTTHFGINKFFTDLANNNKLMCLVKASNAQYNLGDYAYSLFLFSAITASAIALVLVGKEDESEKTVLNVKK